MPGDVSSFEWMIMTHIVAAVLQLRQRRIYNLFRSRQPIVTSQDQIGKLFGEHCWHVLPDGMTFPQKNFAELILQLEKFLAHLFVVWTVINFNAPFYFGGINFLALVFI